MKHENIYSTFYYEGCFHSSIKKSYSVKVSYCLNFDIGEMNVVLMYQANTQCCNDISTKVPQSCEKILQRHDIFLVYCDIKFRSIFPSNTLKVSQKLLSKGLEISRMISCSLVA